MGSYLVAVMTNPRDGMEEEYVDHYANTHLDEVLATTACTSAQHFRLDAQKGAPAGHDFLALYEIEAESAEDALTLMEVGRDVREQSKAVNRRDAAMWVFSPNGDRHTNIPS